MNRLFKNLAVSVILAASLVIQAAAQDALSGDFSKRPEIEKRLAAVRARCEANNWMGTARMCGEG